jgi:hypothetical protein
LYPLYGIPPSPLIWHPAATILRQSSSHLAASYNFLDMLREASTDTATKSFKLEFESVYGGQSSFAGISFDRYLPTAIVLVSVLVAFNFFRHVLLSSTFFVSLASHGCIAAK